MRTRTLLVVLIVLAAVLLIWRPGREPRRAEVGVTAELNGHWTTAEPRHADRYLDIGPEEIVFGQGEEGEAKHRLTAVFLETDKSGRPVYVLRYVMGDAGATVADLRLRVEQGILRLESQPLVAWRRAR